MAIKFVKFAEKKISTIDKLCIHMDKFYKDALKYHNSLQPKRSKIVEKKHEDKIQDEEVHKTSPLTKLLPSSQLAEVNLSDEFDSSSDIHEFEEKFKCRKCQQTFSTESNLNFHMSLVHDISFVENNSLLEDKLSESGTDFNLNNCQLDDDVIEEFDLQNYNEMFKCKVCSAEFEDKEILKIHVESVHGGQTLPKCETCEAIFEDYFDLEKHVESVHDGKTLPHDNQNEKMVNCQLCDDAFENQQKLKEHFESVHDIKKSDTYTQNGGIKLPEWENSEDNYNENMVKCQLCSAEFLNQKILKTHFESVHDIKVPLKCQICNEEFIEQKLLKKHFEYFHDVPVLPEMDKERVCQ